MKIYTKAGDTGFTQVYRKEVLRLSKSDDLLENYGNLDELNSHLGLLIASLSPTSEDLVNEKGVSLHWIQQTLFRIGFALSDEDTLTNEIVEQLEDWIDTLTDELTVQTSFILPGGHPNAAQAHICRTVTRRCERSMVRLSIHYELSPLSLCFINRLSDFFFVFARWLNHIHETKDIEVTQ